MVTVEALSTLLGLEGGEAGTLSLLLAEAEAYLRLTCRLSPEETVPDALLSRVVREDYARLTAEGVSSRAVSGVTERYLSDYSDAVRRGIYAIRHPALPKRSRR